MAFETLAALLARHAAGGDPEATVRAVYDRIAAHDDPALFITLTPMDEALAAARALKGADLAAKPLMGAPFVVKDNIDVAGLPTTAACPAAITHPERSAFVVARLEAAGAIVIGKTNLDQFATGLVGVRSPYGVPRNAVRADLIPGGSSSGSASAVAAGLVPFSLGTDTAGSGRVPAALQGIVGLKPSLGLLSATGMMPACRTLDTISIFAGTVDDAHAVLRVAAGYDAADAYSRALPVSVPGAMPPRLRVGVPRVEDRVFAGDGLAEQAFAAGLDRLSALGATLVPIDMAPFHAVARLLYEGPWVAERYVATRAIIEGHPEAMHPVTRQIIEGARRFDAASGFEATYKLAELRRVCAGVMAGLDMLAVPSIPTIATVEQVLAEPIRINSLLGTYTNFVNLLDLSALAVPTDRRGDGVPAGVTLIGPSGRDASLAAVGRQLHAAAGVPIGASDTLPGLVERPPVAPEGTLPIVVVGAHLSGMPLNGELTRLGATFLAATTTAPDYRLYALAGGPPFRPGLARVTAGTGAAIAVEVWALPLGSVGAFLAGIPAPLGLGTTRLADGTTAKGFICEAEGLVGATDITAFGGWRAYMARAT